MTSLHTRNTVCHYYEEDGGSIYALDVFTVSSPYEWTKIIQCDFGGGRLDVQPILAHEVYHIGEEGNVGWR